MVVDKGALWPADGIARSRLNAKGIHRGDLVFVEMTKPRNPRFHRLVHALGKMVAENIEAFEGYSAHRVLKRLQMEAGVGCEEIAYLLHGHMIVQRVPLSLGYESMDDGEFQEVYKALCREVSKYWGELDADAVAALVDLMPDEPT